MPHLRTVCGGSYILLVIHTLLVTWAAPWMLAVACTFWVGLHRKWGKPYHIQEVAPDLSRLATGHLHLSIFKFKEITG